MSRTLTVEPMSARRLPARLLALVALAVAIALATVLAASAWMINDSTSPAELAPQSPPATLSRYPGTVSTGAPVYVGATSSKTADPSSIADEAEDIPVGTSVTPGFWPSDDYDCGPGAPC